MTTRHKKCITLLCCSFLLFPGCVLFDAVNYGPVSVMLNKNFDQSKVKRIAAFPFDTSGYNGPDRDSGRLLADWYSAELIKTGYYDVIERYQVEKILQEQGFQMTGAVDMNSAVRAGRLLGAQALLMGSAAGIVNSYTVTARLVDVETGNSVWAVVYESNHPKRAVPRLKDALDSYYASKAAKK